MNEVGPQDWNQEQREQWIKDYLADRCVDLPNPEHERGLCGDCDALRDLVLEAEIRDAIEISNGHG